MYIDPAKPEVEQHRRPLISTDVKRSLGHGTTMFEQSQRNGPFPSTARRARKLDRYQLHVQRTEAPARLGAVTVVGSFVSFQMLTRSVSRGISHRRTRAVGVDPAHVTVQKCVIECFAGDVGAPAVQDWPRKAHCRSGLRIRTEGLAVDRTTGTPAPAAAGSAAAPPNPTRNRAVRCWLTVLARRRPRHWHLLPPRWHAQLDVETCHVAKSGRTRGRRDEVAQFPQKVHSPLRFA